MSGTFLDDVTGTMSGLLLALLAAHGQSVKYVPGRIGNRMSEAYRGEAKTDARDAYVIAESVRQRGDLTDVEVSATLVAEPRLLVTHRTDLARSPRDAAQPSVDCPILAPAHPSRDLDWVTD